MREEIAARPVLRLAAGTPGRRRVARAVLLEAVAAAGGRVEEREGEVVLRDAEPARLRPLRDLLQRLIGGAFLLPPAPALPDLDRWLGEVEPAALLLPLRGWRLTGSGAVPAFTRLEVGRKALGAALGPLGEDADLLDHAEARLTARLLAAPGEAIGRAVPPAGRLHLRLPLAMAAAAKASPTLPDLVLSLPLEAAAGPNGPAAAGCAIELDVTEPAILPLIEPAALPAGLLRLRWSPTLDLPPGLDPARVVLAGADGREAAAWARHRGILLVEAEESPGG